MSNTATLPNAFPWSVWNQLTGIDLRLLDELIFLSKRHAANSPRRAHYCTPGRKYLARKLGCAIVTVSRHISKLKRLGILDAFQRRPVGGTWQTNFYRVMSWQAWKFGQVRGMVAALANRVSQQTHIAPTIVGKIQQDKTTVAFGTLFDRWMSRGRDTSAA